MNPRQKRQARARKRLTDASRATASNHALQRAQELGFTEEDVHRCVASPEQTYPCPARFGPNRSIYQRHDIGVVLAEDTRTIVTVLLRTARRWEHRVDTRATLLPSPLASTTRQPRTVA